MIGSGEGDAGPGATGKAGTQGDHQAFGDLLAQHHRLVMAIAYGYLGQWDDAEDIAQDVFIQAYLKLKYLREPERSGYWLRQITARASIDALRRRRPGCPWGEMAEQLADDVDEQTTLERLCLHETLAMLPEKTRMTVLLCYGSEYSHAETASILGVPVNTVRSRLQSAKRLLAKEKMMGQDNMHDRMSYWRLANPNWHQVDLHGGDCRAKRISLFSGERVEYCRRASSCAPFTWWKIMPGKAFYPSVISSKTGKRRPIGIKSLW